METLLEAFPPGRKPSLRLLKALAQEARSEGEQSARCLLELYFRQKRSVAKRAARMVLEGLPGETLAAVSQSVAPGLTPEQARELEEILFVRTARSAAATTDDAPVPEKNQRLYYTAAELLDVFLQALEDSNATEPEAVGLVWLRGFRGLPLECRVPVLQALAQRPDPTFVPILEAEAQNPAVEVRRTVAGILPSFRYEEALALARRLHDDEDILVRYDAAKAEQALLNVRNLPAASRPPAFDHAYCLALPQAGVAGVLYATRDANHCIKFCSILIDTWSRGIVDAWGNIDCDDEQFADVLLAFASQVSEAAMASSTTQPDFQAISQYEALELIRAGADLTVRRGRRLPAEYALWERLFRHDMRIARAPQPGGSTLLEDFAFDLHCTCCTRPISANRKRTNVAVSNGQAFCKRCLTRERKCAGCGREYRLAALSSRRLASAVTHARCSRCVKGL